MVNAEISKLETQIMELNEKVTKLRRDVPPVKVKNYSFDTLTGKVSLLDLFGDKDTLFMIHNMGQGCRYCTLWADGFNPFVPHLEDQFALALVSKDKPDVQRRFSNERGWRFRMVSHGGKGEYIDEQSNEPGGGNLSPGMAVYTRKGTEIFKKSWAQFGPGDLYCSFWHVLNLAGRSGEDVFPQFSYWKRPEKLDDGGTNLR